MRARAQDETLDFLTNQSAFATKPRFSVEDGVFMVRGAVALPNPLAEGIENLRANGTMSDADLEK